MQNYYFSFLNNKTIFNAKLLFSFLNNKTIFNAKLLFFFFE